VNIAYILFTYLVLFSLGIIDNSRGPIYPELLKLFSITKTQGSFIFTVTSLISFGVTLLSPYWLKSFGALKSTKFALLMHFIACLLMGFASQYSWGFYLFLLASTFVGIGIGISSLTVNLIITNSVSKNHRRKLFSGLHAMYGISALLAPTILSFIFKNKMSWSNYLFVISVIPLLILISFFTLKSKNITEEKKHPSKILKKHLYILCAIFSFYVSAEMLIATRLVIYLNEVKSYGLDESSVKLSLFFLFLLIGRVTFSFVHLKLHTITILKLSVFGSILFTLLGIFYSGELLPITGLFMSIFFPFGMDWLSHNYGEDIDFIVSRVMTVVGGSLVVMHFIFGYLATQIGLEFAFMIAPVMLIVVLYLLHFKTNFLAND
jgi:fucose permease